MNDKTTPAVLNQVDANQQSQQINQLQGHLGKISQASKNVFVLGRVVDAEKEKHESDPPIPDIKEVSAPHPSVLVQIGGEKPEHYTRFWMPWLVNRAGQDTQWWKPVPNEQVIVIAPSGNWVQGIIIGSLYKERHLSFDKEGKKVVQHKIPEKEDEHIHSTIYRDGTRFDYDPLKHKYTLSLRDEVKTEKAILTWDCQLNDDKKPLMSLNLLEGEDGISHFSLDASKKGKIDIIAGKEGNDKQCAIVLEPEKGIAINVHDKATIVITHEGEMTITCKKDISIKSDANINITAKDDLNIKAKNIKMEADTEINVDAPTINLKKDVIISGTLDVKS